MKPNFTFLANVALVAAVALPALAPAQTIGIRHSQAEDRVRIDVDTIPSEQCWLTYSADLIQWTKHTFVDQPVMVNLGPPAAGSHFFRLDPLYGQITWSTRSNMPVARDQFTGGAIDGKLYLFGGNGDPDGINLSRLDIYDLNTGEWTRGADYAFGIEELSSAVVGGKLYVFGGWAGAPVRVNLCYDPVSNGWSETAPKPTQIQAAVVVAWGEEILVLGGSLPGDARAATVVEAYHTVSNTWRVVTHLPEPSFAFGAGIHENVLYLVGGLNYDSFALHNLVRRFDLTQGIWLPDIDGILPHPILAGYHSACPVVNGKLIIGGGATTSDGEFLVPDLGSALVNTNLVTVYDIQKNTFSHNAPLPEAFDRHLFLLAGHELFALGGASTPDPFGDHNRTSRMVVGRFEE